MRLVISSTPDPLDFRTVRHAYDTVAEDYATHLPDTRAEAPLDLAMIDAFAEAVTSGDDARVLDAGCGAGRMSRYLAERGCLVEGVDLSSSMVAMARRDQVATCSSVSSPAKVRATCLGHIASSVRRSNWSATATRRIKLLPRPRLLACKKSAAWCDALRARRGTIRPSCLPRPIETPVRRHERTRAVPSGGHKTVMDRRPGASLQANPLHARRPRRLG